MAKKSDTDSTKSTNAEGAAASPVDPSPMPGTEAGPEGAQESQDAAQRPPEELEHPAQQQAPQEAAAPQEPEEPFWNTGYDHAQQKIDQAAEDRKRRKEDASKPWRFYIEADTGEEKLVTFVDDDTVINPVLRGMPPFQFNEHQMYLNGRWMNWFTCLGKGCPICATGKAPYFAAVYTVIEHTTYKDRDGVEHSDPIRLFVAKPDVLAIIKRLSGKKSGLRGLQVSITRVGEKSPNVGSNFIPEEKITLAPEIQPVDYPKIFAKMPAERIARLIGQTRGAEGVIPF